MFLSSLSKTCTELGMLEDSKEFSSALSSMLCCASHTNTMMWVGRMEHCPLDLPSQGQLLKQGTVSKKSLGTLSRRGRVASFKKSPGNQLLLFQKTLVLCKNNENLSEPDNPHLYYELHIR